MFGDNLINKESSTVFVYDISSNVWSVPKIESSIEVLPRYDHFAFVIPGNKMLIIGGKR